jgi:hypothetical protein
MLHNSKCRTTMAIEETNSTTDREAATKAVMTRTGLMTTRTVEVVAVRVKAEAGTTRIIRTRISSSNVIRNSNNPLRTNLLPRPPKLLHSSQELSRSPRSNSQPSMYPTWTIFREVIRTTSSETPSSGLFNRHMVMRMLPGSQVCFSTKVR